MPRNVRNSWLSVACDGRSPVSLGPKSARGELSIQLQIREEGAISQTTIFLSQCINGDTIVVGVHEQSGEKLTCLYRKEFKR